MTPAERLSVWMAQLRASGRSVRVVRAGIGLAGSVALVVPGLQAWDQADAVLLFGIPMLLVAVLLPDSPAGMVFLFIVAGGWLFRGPAEAGAGITVTGMALVVFHVLSAFAAQLPSYVRPAPRTCRRWLLPTAICLVVVPVVATAAAAVQGAEVPGSVLVTAAALALATGVTWFAAARD